MTTRLYYTDATLLDFAATVVDHDGDMTRVILDQTAFYPTSGGQPHDTGMLSGVPVIDVLDDDVRIIHVLAAPLPLGEVRGTVDAARRIDHMEQHTAQHLLSAIAADTFGWETASVHFGADHSTIEFAVANGTDTQLAELAARAQAAIRAALPVVVTFEQAAGAVVAGLRKAPPREGELRVVTIAGLDRSACGGTHVASTAAIGPIVLTGVEKLRGHLRVGFLAGGRVLAHLAERDALVATLARTLSCAEAELAALIPKRQEELQALRAQLAALEAELAVHRVRALLDAATPDAVGVRHVVHHATTESAALLKAMAQAVAAEPKAVLILVSTPSVVLGSSADSGVDVGALLKATIAAHGGKGGGSPRLAQGVVPSDRLANLIDDLRAGR
jgi:alanyl-tRNA synthetase